MTQDEAKRKYLDYLEGHISNVQHAVELFEYVGVQFVKDNIDKLKEIASEHDKSKYDEPEWTPYLHHFYPTCDEEKLETEAFEQACTHHIKSNKHHWDYWLDENNELNIDDEYEYKLYCVERCADWLAMACQHGEDSRAWYDANKDAIQMPDYGWELCDEIMSKVPSDLDLGYNGVRGNLDEANLNEWVTARDVTEEELDKNPCYLSTHYTDSNGEEHHNRTDFDNISKLFNYIKQCGGFNSCFDHGKIMYFICSDYKGGEFYLIRNKYAKGGWVWEDCNGVQVEHESFTFRIKPELKDAIKDMYQTATGSYMIDLNDGWHTTSGDSYVEGLDKNDAISTFNYNVYKDDMNESDEYWKRLEPRIEDDPSDKRGVAMYKNRIKKGQHRPILVNTDGDVLDGNHTLTAYQELGVKPPMLYRGTRKDFYDAVAKSGYNAEKAIHYMIDNGTAVLVESINTGITKSILNDVLSTFNMHAVQSANKKVEFTILSKNDKKVGTAYFSYPNDIRLYVFGNKETLYVPDDYDYYGDSHYEKLIDSFRSQFSSILNKGKKTSEKKVDNNVQLSLDLDESFKVLRGNKGYLIEANMKQLKRKTLSEDPTRAKKSKHVQSKYIGISKYGVLNFETTSETHSGVKWYQEVHFPSFNGFMNIIEQGDDIEAEDVKKAMASDNIKISCFTEDTEVQTLDGMKKIKDIKVGDKVLTHTGKYQDVLQTFENDYSGEMIEINGVKSTPNHPYLVKLPNGDIEWKMACEITKDMKLLAVEE